MLEFGASYIRDLTVGKYITYQELRTLKTQPITHHNETRQSAKREYISWDVP